MTGPRGVALLACLGAALAGAPGGASAALVPQAAPDTAVITLEEALSRARGSNPTYRQAVNRAGLNETEMQTTLFSQVLPQASLNLFDTYYRGNLTRSAVDPFGNPIRLEDPNWTYFSQTSQSLQLSWQIQGKRIFDALDRQKLANLDRDLGEVRALTDLQVEVRRAYMDVLEQRDLLREEEELLEGRRTDQDVAERLFRLAMKTRVDVLNAELAVEQQLLAVQQQAARLEQARLALRTRMGDPDLGPFRLADEDMPIFDPAALSEEALVDAADEVNPELRQARTGVEASETQLSFERGSWWPTLWMNYTISRQAQNTETDALFDLSFDEDLDQRFFISLQFPMFNSYFQNRQSMRQARVDLANSLETRRETALRIEEQVRSAYLELENQYVTLRLAERSATIAEEALRLAREEYRLGSRDFEALRSAFDQEAETRRQVITARHAFVDALLSLEAAVGAPVRPDAPGAPGAGG